MTLDEARDAFEANKCETTARAYYKTAQEYWVDEIISNETMAQIATETAGMW